MSKAYSVGEQIADILDDYSREVKEVTDKAIQEVAKETVNTLKNTSPKRTGAYAKGWSVKKDGDEVVVYNRTHAQLTHLLELGHAKVNGGRVEGQEHIKPAEELAEANLMRIIERELK